MNETFFTPAHIHPRIDVFGSSQFLNFFEKNNSFVLSNAFDCSDFPDANTAIEFRDFNYNGFRFNHLTNQNIFGLDFVQGDSVVSPVFDFSAAVKVFNFYKPVSLNQNRLTNLAPGINTTDAATVGQLSTIQPNLSVSTGTLSPSKLTGYPTSSSYFLRGDGAWAQADINTNTSGSLNINRLIGYPSNSNTFLRGDGAWATPPSSSSYINTLPINGDLNLSGYSLTTTGHIFVDVIRPTFSGMSRVWIGGNGVVAVDDSRRKFQVFYYGAGSTEFYVRPNVSWLDMRGANVYGSKTSTILETNAGGETCSIVMNGDFMQFINPLNTLGFIFTDEDNSSMSSYVAYINGAGQYISACSKEGKHSIVKKEHKDYLERLNKLNIYSYTRKHEILPSDPEQRRARKTRKMNTLQVGVLAEEVLEIFDNATNVFKPLDATVPAPSHTPPLGVDYNTLLCYAILAIQELTTEVKQLKAGAKPL